MAKKNLKALTPQQYDHLLTQLRANSENIVAQLILKPLTYKGLMLSSTIAIFLLVIGILMIIASIKSSLQMDDVTNLLEFGINLLLLLYGILLPAFAYWLVMFFYRPIQSGINTFELDTHIEFAQIVRGEIVDVLVNDDNPMTASFHYKFVSPDSGNAVMTTYRAQKDIFKKGEKVSVYFMLEFLHFIDKA